MRFPKSLCWPTSISKGIFPSKGMLKSIVDSGYRNEWMVIVVDVLNKEVTLTKGDRMCQIILSKVHEYQFIDEDKLPESERGLR